jgi:1-acyl-sn-glycerol-3-phosphate acyltransferase
MKRGCAALYQKPDPRGSISLNNDACQSCISVVCWDLHLDGLFAMEGCMADIDYQTSNRRISWIARQIPGVVFYAKTVLDIITASRLSRKGFYTIEKQIASSAGVIKTLEIVGTNVRVENILSYKNLISPCVFVGNHMSVLETFILPSFIMPYRKITFVLKKSLTQYPLFRNIIRSLNPIVVDRENPRHDLRKVLEEGLDCLKKNVSVLIFPQTTRSLSFDPKKFNTLGIKLAKRGNVPVIPVAVKTDTWGIGRLFKDIGKIDPTKPVRISFGDPVYIGGNGKQEHQQIIDFISSKLNHWK